MDLVPEITVEKNMVSTVIILTSGSPKAEDQLDFATDMFEDLKFSKIIWVQGIDSEKRGTYPRGKVGPMSSMAWLLAFGPKLLKMVERIPYGLPFCIAEDSVWPTDACTPSYLHTVFHHYRHYGYDAVWAGAVTMPRKRKIDSTEICTPGGSKLFIATRGFVEKAYEILIKTDKTMFVDGVMHHLVAKQVLVVMPKFLAGSQDERWSARQKQYVSSHVEGLPLVGAPLSKRRNATGSARHDDHDPILVLV